MDPEASRTVSCSRAEVAIADFSDLDLARCPHDALLPRIWARRKKVTAYDAADLALAEALDAPLLTADEKLVRSPGHKARVEVVAPG